MPPKTGSDVVEAIVTKAATSTVYPLKYPFDYVPAGQENPVTVNEITLRRPKAKDMRLQDEVRAKGGGEIMATLALIASINGLPMDAVDELDAEDLMEVSEKIVGFLPERLLQKDGEG